MPSPSVIDCYLAPWKKYATFSGRARRSEYWWFTLINGVIHTVLMVAWVAAIIATASTSESGDLQFGDGFPWGILFGLVFLVFTVVTMVPAWAVTVRRLHDIGKSGWWALLSLLPVVMFVVVVFTFLDSDVGPNEYGPSPKYP